MPQNRPIPSSQMHYAQSSFLDIDTTIVHFPEHEVTNENNDFYHITKGSSELVEISQQQLSRWAAGTLMLCFLLFLFGYHAGRMSFQQNELRGKDTELVPSSVSCAVASVGSQDYLHHEKVSPDMRPAKDYGRFSMKGEAATCCEALKKNGIHVHILERTSRTAAGDVKVWYQVCCEEQVNEANIRDTIINTGEFQNEHAKKSL